TRHAFELWTREAANAIGPAERLFDELAPALAHSIARMPRGAVVNGALHLLFSVRRHAHGPQIGNEICRVIALVGADREAPRRARRCARSWPWPPLVRRCRWLV